MLFRSLSENLELGFGALGDPFLDAWCALHLLNELSECRVVLQDLDLEHGLDLGQTVGDENVGPGETVTDKESTRVLFQHRIESRQFLRCIHLNNGLQKLGHLCLVTLRVEKERVQSGKLCKCQITSEG